MTDVDWNNIKPPALNKKDFEKQFMQVFEPDKRQIDIDERLTDYYRKTWPDHVSNKEAMTHWREFKEWATYSGYTNKEINAAKQRCNNINLKD